MNMQDLRNLMVFPEIVPEYHQKHGREYCNPGHPEVTWKFIKSGTMNFFDIRKPVEENRQVAYDVDMGKRFVEEVLWSKSHD